MKGRLALTRRCSAGAARLRRADQLLENELPRVYELLGLVGASLP